MTTNANKYASRKKNLYENDILLKGHVRCTNAKIYMVYEMLHNHTYYQWFPKTISVLFSGIQL